MSASAPFAKGQPAAQPKKPGRKLGSDYGPSLYQDLIRAEFGGAPWDRHDALRERSPLRSVQRVTTPTLLLHGEADKDVPITQSEDLYTAFVRGQEPAVRPHRLAELVDALGRRPASRAAGF